MSERPIPIEEMVELFKERHTTSHLFKIDNFSLLGKYQVKSVESSVFNLCGYKMKITVYPNGISGKDGHVSISLENQDSRNVKYVLYVVSQKERRWHPTAIMVAKSTSPEKIIPLISHDDLKAKGFMIEDCCMFGVELYGVTPAKSGTAECFRLIEKPPNHKVTWMMTKFSSFNPDILHRSNEFEIGNIKWRIEVYPKGYAGEKDKSFSVFLRAEGFKDNVPKTNTFAKVILRVLDQFHWHHIEKADFGWIDTIPDYMGYGDFMPLKKLAEPYLVKDKLYVGVDCQVISVANYC